MIGWFWLFWSVRLIGRQLIVSRHLIDCPQFFLIKTFYIGLEWKIFVNMVLYFDETVSTFPPSLCFSCWGFNCPLTPINWIGRSLNPTRQRPTSLHLLLNFVIFMITTVCTCTQYIACYLVLVIFIYYNKVKILLITWLLNTIIISIPILGTFVTYDTKLLQRHCHKKCFF